MEEISIVDNVDFNDVSLEEKNQLQKRKQRKDQEEKDREREKYKEELREQGYKRLMHLLNKSRFYTSFLLNKIDKSKEIEKATKKKENINDKDASLPRKKIKLNYDINKQIQTVKNKLNLSNEEIEELVTDSDVENEIPDNTAIKLKYFHGNLRDYQQKGLQWLKVLYENGLNGILADEMGLGKTIQVIALICYLIEKKQSGPYLIISPLSVISHWMSEFEKFAPDIPVILFYGSKHERPAIRKKIICKHMVANNYKTKPIVITTYETIRYESKFIQSEIWRYIIIDEGQKIKNHKCLLFNCLKNMESMNRLILTGTPLQNDLSELWSLLNFLLPDIFNELSVFESLFDLKEFNEEGAQKILKQEEEKQVLSSLREILKPFMLRRIKSDVCFDIPFKKELIIYTPLTLLQHDLYKAVLNRNYDMLTKLETPDLILPTVNGKRMKRKCTLHASNVEKYSDENVRLTEKSSEEINELKSNDEKLSMWKKYTDVTERNRDFLTKIQINQRWIMYKKIVNHPYLIHCPLDSTGLIKIDEDIIKTSGKFLVVDAMLAKLKAQGHKVLLFSTFTMILDMLENYLMLRDYVYVRLDGQTKLDKRQEIIEQFNNDTNIFLFLISTRAGGVGLNLTGADTVIIFDSDWNPQADIQAMARCHRIGQTKPVVIYRLCTKGTIDETIIKRSETKRTLEKVMISQEWVTPKLNQTSLMNLKRLLEAKEYNIVTSENHVFTEAELNKLLDRSDLILH